VALDVEDGCHKSTERGDGETSAKLGMAYIEVFQVLDLIFSIGSHIFEPKGWVKKE